MNKNKLIGKILSQRKSIETEIEVSNHGCVIYLGSLFQINVEYFEKNGYCISKECSIDSHTNLPVNIIYIDENMFGDIAETDLQINAIEFECIDPMDEFEERNKELRNKYSKKIEPIGY